MRRNVKTNDKKKNLVKRYTDNLELSNKIVKSCLGQLKLRCARVITTMNNQKTEIDNLGRHHNNFKEAVIKYHTKYIEKNKDEDLAFLKALEESNVNGPCFEDILDNQMKSIKKESVSYVTPYKNYANKSMIYQKETSTKKDFSTITLSPITPNHNLSTLIRSHDHSTHFGDVSMESGTSSPISMNNSLISQSNNSRIKKNHNFDNNPVTKKVCNYCPIVDSKLFMFKCFTCGVYVHEVCRDQKKHQICIPIKETKLKIQGSRSLKLSDITTISGRPFVPGIFLAVMHHIHMFGFETDNIFTHEGDQAQVKQLCNKLLHGKLKHLIKSDIRVVSNALMMLLENLNEPLLPRKTANELAQCNEGSADDLLNGIVTCLRMLPLDILDTLVYVIVHLKVILTNGRGYNSKRLADKFSKLLVGSYCDLKIIEVVDMLINLDIRFYSQNFIPEKIFFMPYFTVFADNARTTPRE